MVVLALGGIDGGARRALRADAARSEARCSPISTVENIGIIFIGLGLALAFQANGMAVAAALALTAALFHVFNHSLFKSLLFFGAGAVLNATGERDMEKLGGLIHRMPQTAFAFLVGCVAISALPPLNGFVSEWLTFQAILLSPDLPQWGLKFLVPAVGALLALSAALAAACFVKAFGITFPRPAAHAGGGRSARETDRFSLAAMFALAALCLVAGILPGLFIDALAPVVTDARRRQHAGADRRCPGSRIVPIAESRSSYNGLLVFLFITSRRSLAAFAIHRLGIRQAAPRRRPGIAAFPTRARRRNTRPAASRSRSAACSARVVFRAREIGRDAAARRRCAPARLDCRAARSDLGHALRADRLGVVGYAPTALNHAAVPHHPPLSQPRVRGARRCCSWCWRYGADPRSRHRRARRCCWCCCWRRCSPASCAR